ncbi:MAG: hypothetical protein ACRCT1_01415 [Microcoleaceae cyanobacterium]
MRRKSLKRNPVSLALAIALPFQTWFLEISDFPQQSPSSNPVSFVLRKS